MARRSAAFSQSDVTRAVKGAQAAGMRPNRVEIDRDGRIIVATIAGREERSENTWDDVLE